jgi:hypothetical protein
MLITLTTNNYNTFTNVQALQINAAHTKYSVVSLVDA